MKTRDDRSWFTRRGIAALFAAIGVSASCTNDDPTGVAPQDARAVGQAQVTASADSTDNPVEDDNCFWLDGRWICLP